MKFEWALSVKFMTGSFGRLSGGLAHDINNILGIALGNLELVLERAEQGNRKEITRQAQLIAVKVVEAESYPTQSPVTQYSVIKPTHSNRILVYLDGHAEMQS